jgi:nicotinamide mononucleotide transporter
MGIEIAAALFGLACVYLAVRQNIWSWPVGIVNVALYFVVFQQARLYADMGLQVVYLALSLYGWYQWLYGGPGRKALPVSRTSSGQFAVLVLIGAAGAWLTGMLLVRHTDASLPYLDSALTSTSRVAQWMMTRKLLESWLLWISVDIVYVGMFIHKSLYPTAVLYAVFTVLAVLGYAQWKRTPDPAAAT